MPIDTRELMKQVTRIRVLTTRLVDDFIGGAYHSVFKGQGIEFNEVREYVPGDDVRTIDWNVTARTGHPFIKRFVEERELNVVFMVDVSGSQCFGSGNRAKAERAAEITCLMALSAVRNQDKIGALLFSDRIEKFIPPRKGRQAAMRFVREVLAMETTRHATDIAAALRFLNSVQKRRSVVFLISDFLDDGYLNELRVTARRHDVICCPLSDQREVTLPAAGLLELEDAETGEVALVDTASAEFRAAFAEAAAQRRRRNEEVFAKCRIDALWVDTERPFIDDLRNLFARRQKRRAGR